MTIGKNAPLSPIYSMIILSHMGYGFVIPLVPILFLAPDGIHLPTDTSYHIRTLLLGAFLSIYFVAQIIGGPLWGISADYFGRKKVLIFMVIGGSLSYLLSAFAVLEGNLLYLFIGRFITGLVEGTTTISKAFISDVSHSENRIKNFSKLTIFNNIGFFFGALLGGELSNHKLVSWFNFSTPFFAMALISFICALILIPLKESKNRKITPNRKKSELFHTLKSAVNSKKMTLLFSFLFLYAFAGSLFNQTFQIFLYGKYKTTHEQIGLIYAYGCIWLILSQYFFANPMAKFIKSFEILRWTIILTVPAILLLLISKGFWTIFYIFPVMLILQGITGPNLVESISELTDSEHQGRLQGQCASINALAFLLAPLVGGALIPYIPSLPITVGAFITFLAYLAFLRLYRLQKLSL